MLFDFKDRSMYFSGFGSSCASVEDLQALYDLIPVVVEKEAFEVDAANLSHDRSHEANVLERQESFQPLVL